MRKEKGAPRQNDNYSVQKVMDSPFAKMTRTLCPTGTASVSGKVPDATA